MQKRFLTVCKQGWCASVIHISHLKYLHYQTSVEAEKEEEAAASVRLFLPLSNVWTGEDGKILIPDFTVGKKSKMFFCFFF